MRRFSAEYLEDTRRGMWEDRDALADLDLSGRDRILDVGCGSGELTRVLLEESDATVVGVDADRSLLGHADADERVQGDAVRLPFSDDAFDLVVCQALLINLPDPVAAIREFARVSSDLVAAIEPDNSAVEVESTVTAEEELSRRARERYIDGLDTDVALGAEAAERFREADLAVVSTRPYRHVRTIEAPYSEAAVKGAAMKVTGERIADRRGTMLAGEFAPEEFGALLEEWRAMGREVVDQMRSGEYARAETIPFYVTVGRT